MSLNATPASERIHIGIFGKRNAGKSSLINALTGQNLAIVSDVRGTTTDPVFKAMELLPLGPVVMIDTPGLDDTGELGKLRIQKAYQVLNKTDIAVLVVDGTTGITPQDNAILTRIQDKKIPLLLVRLPCYDLAPITSFALGRSLRSRTLGAPGFHGLTGGVYKARERIHRAMADARLLANPASWGRVADPSPN